MFYLQHGHGKSNKIEHCAKNGHVSGVILSPGHEDVGNLIETARLCASQGIRVLLDPQSYVYTTDPQGEMRFHSAQGLDFSAMHWAQSAAELTNMVEAVKTVNERAGIAPPWICPAPFHRNLTDYWMPAALQFARTARDSWGTEFLVTIAMDESILADWDKIADWLDVLTTLDVSGFYLLVSRRSPLYPPAAWPSKDLCNLLRMIHVLSVLNEYEVIWAYSDIDGLFGLAAGASGLAAGWTYGLRQFSVERYNTKRGGGAAAVPRVYVPEFLTDIRFNEAEDIFRGIEDGYRFFSQETQERFHDRPFDALGNPEAQLQHLVELSVDAARLANMGSLSTRVEALLGRLQRAKDSFAEISGHGLAVDPRYSSRVNNYSRALTEFAELVDL